MKQKLSAPMDPTAGSSSPSSSQGSPGCSSGGATFVESQFWVPPGWSQTFPQPGLAFPSLPREFCPPSNSKPSPPFRPGISTFLFTPCAYLESLLW